MTDFWQKHAAEWQRPGALVRDPVTGCRFVCYSAQDGVTRWVYCDGLAQGLTHVHPRQSGGDSAVNRAIAAGPVLDDDAMRGILLAWLVQVWKSIDDYRFVRVAFVYSEPVVGLDDVALGRVLPSIPCALRWALESPDSPVREGSHGE